MKKIRKFQYAGKVSYPGLNTMSLKLENPMSPQLLNLSTLLSLNPNWGQSFLLQTQSYSPKIDVLKKINTGNQAAAAGINALTLFGTDYASEKLFGDSELGLGLGTIFSAGVSSTGNTIANNLIKGNYLAQGLGLNVGISLAGAGAGLTAHYIGKGINAAGGDSRLSRGIGQGVATGLGTIGGAALANIMKYGKAGSLFSKGADSLSIIGKGANSIINPWGLSMLVAGTALGAALGPSKEYSGKYGTTTRTMDAIYDIATAGAALVPGGQILSGVMALNKGLSNVFGSTSGMTKTDAILGSAFMPAPIKWLNMAGALTTDTFKSLSWLNQEKANTFMGNAFGNLGDKFDKARLESGKTYGTFSGGAYDKALREINFANNAWNLILAMAGLNEILNIRSQAMSSINNLRYAQDIIGGWSPLYRGKHGMKILNNATNHNIGMRLLSGAALIDNKQMILCSVQD